MKVKKLNSFEEEPMVTEASQADIENIKSFVQYIQQNGIPNFSVVIKGWEGTVIIDGAVRFTTSGANTVPTIFAYVSGVFLGLKYK